MTALKDHVEQWLYREARLADDFELDAWLGLWDDKDVLYWVPCNKDDVDPRRELSIIYDNRARLELRVARMKSGMAWTQEPRSRLRRMLANIEVEDRKDHMMALANFHVTELRQNKPGYESWVGRTEYRLRPRGDDYRLFFKKVWLINNDQEMTQLSFLI